MQTPIDIWQNFEAMTSGFNASILGDRIIGEHTVREIYVTTLKNGAENSVRTYVRIAFPNGIKKNQLAIYVPSTKRVPTDEELIALADGYAVATFDYLGLGKGIGNSIYSGEFSNLAFSACKDSLNKVPTLASETCWAGWIRITRGVISYLLSSAFICPTSRVVLIGEEEGAVIMWHTAAFDNRICAGVSILGYGYPPFKMLDAIDSEKYVLSEEDEKWISGISSQSVAQYVNIPILSLISSNNPAINMERLADVIGFLKDETLGNLSISPKSGANLADGCYYAMSAFIKANLKNLSKNYQLRPTITDKKDGSTLKLTIKIDKIPSKVFIMVANANANAEYRNWTKIEATLQNKDEGLYTADVNINDYSDKLFYYCSAIYKEGRVSSLVYDEIIPHIDFKKGSNRILYESRFGEDSFTSENAGGLYVPYNNIHLEVGPCLINGVTVTKGSLVWFKLGDAKYAATDDLILQLDLAAKKETDVAFKILKKVEGKLQWFMTKVTVKPSEKWTKLSLPHQDFKTEEFIVMKSWDNILKFKIEGIEDGDVLFNNVLFI